MVIFATTKMGNFMEKFIGREEESRLLNEYVNSGKSEFIAIYGRRRIGKTFLVNQVLGDFFTFSVSGVIDGTYEEEMEAFVEALTFAGHQLNQRPKNWLQAFAELRLYIESKQKKNIPCVLFIDELPCFDTQRSGFVKALGHFWNSWASLQNNLTLVVCGSATSWMLSNIVDNKGGLHNRVTHEIALNPFNLKETEQYLESRGIFWGQDGTLQCYMAFGGVAYYLSLLSPVKSLAQNLDLLLFAPNGELRREYPRLFGTLFDQPEPYYRIIELLFTNKSGMTRTELLEKLGKNSNGGISTYLRNLVNCGFVRSCRMRNKTIKRNGNIYQLSDFFVLFYLNFVSKSGNDNHYWTTHLASPEVNSWRGLAFERVCMMHIEQIKKALGIEGISVQYYTWRSQNSDTGAQIDLVLERADAIANICEIKYSSGEYVLDKEEWLKLRNRENAFRTETKFKGGTLLTMITANGLSNNGYGASVPICINGDVFFH